MDDESHFPITIENRRVDRIPPPFHEGARGVAQRHSAGPASRRLFLVASTRSSDEVRFRTPSASGWFGSSGKTSNTPSLCSARASCPSPRAEPVRRHDRPVRRGDHQQRSRRRVEDGMKSGDDAGASEFFVRRLRGQGDHSASVGSNVHSRLSSYREPRLQLDRDPGTPESFTLSKTRPENLERGQGSPNSPR